MIWVREYSFIIADFGDIRILMQTKKQAYLFATDQLGLG